jgi:hypothetical protein
MNCNQGNVRRALKGARRSALVLATIFFVSSPLFAQVPTMTSVKIAYGTPTASTNTITINGNFFYPKEIAPTAVLGVTPLTVNPGFTNTKIVGTFPSSLAPGAYLLTVMNHPDSNSGVFVVKNGAMGLQGQAPPSVARAKRATRQTALNRKKATNRTNGTAGANVTNRTNGTNGTGATNGPTDATESMSISSLCSVLFPNASAAQCSGSVPTTSPKIVFVTSGAYTGNLGGTANGNAICQKEAERAGLRGTYKTWLSTASGSDNSGPSFTQGPRPTFPSGYILIDGPTVSSLAALTTPALNSGGGFDAQDGLAPSQPATGDPSGAIIKATAATATESACNGWTISTSAPNGTGGAYTGAAPSAPDALQEHEIVECGPAHYLYCIQQ